MAPKEIQAVLKFADAEIVAQKNNIVVWRLHRKTSRADGGGTAAK